MAVLLLVSVEFCCSKRGLLPAVLELRGAYVLTPTRDLQDCTVQKMVLQ